MNERQKLALSEKAHKDYVAGMKYKDIAEKYDVSINTVKSWKARYAWTRNNAHKKGANSKRVQELENEKFKGIKQDLLKQLEEKGIFGKHYEDLINDYMALWNIKNRLIEDIDIRGVSVAWNNGKQEGMKKNDSIPELNKTSAQMLKILNELGLKPSSKGDDFDDL
ncbi:P27 family phage terminase small subunit [Clostridium sp. B9]|uniref:P27 family phage terminase small subunit n=1 Tax=Clostridium sp. B9 TaxID=3423224 RepID=UPI003D2EBCDF